MVSQLAEHLATSQPGLRGFTRSNLFRMRQFYETYRAEEKVAPLVRQLSWSHNCQTHVELPLFGPLNVAQTEES